MTARASILLGAGLVLSGPVYIGPGPAGNLIVTQPGSSPYRPPIYLQARPVNRLDGSRPWIATQPGSNTAPIYIIPNPTGRGLILEQPGQNQLEDPE